MSEIRFFHCDGPACLEADERAGDEQTLQEAGWLILTFADVDEQHISHFHSYDCLLAWTVEACQTD